MCKHSHLLIKISLIIGGLLLVGFLIMFKITFVAGQSMEPTLRDKQVMLVKKVRNSYLKNDIITFYNVKYGECVKRIVGEEGDQIQLKDGKVYRNNIEFSSYTCEKDIEKDYKLKSGDLFVIGDNSGASKDSREYGPISVDDIIGKVILY